MVPPLTTLRTGCNLDVVGTGVEGYGRWETIRLASGTRLSMPGAGGGRVYVSTYFPEGVEIAKALAASGSTPRCLMGLANVDEGFVAKATLAEAQRCVFSGVPAATEMPSAMTYVRRYRATFGKAPSVWGSFTYDSARILFAAIDKAKSYRFAAVERELRGTKRFRGATGTITINPRTGYRATVPVSILQVDNRKKFVIVK